MALGKIHPGMEVVATFRTLDPVPPLPRLTGLAAVADVSRYHPDTHSEIRVRLHETEPAEVIEAIQEAGVRLARLLLSASYRPEFWAALPDDIAGAVLAPDGHVAVSDPTLRWRVVPLTDPLHISGRPEADGGRAGAKPDLVRAGGVPIVSDGLLAALRRLGADGETGQVLYRGANKAARDTVQPGYQRFLPRPWYELPYRGGIEFLSEGIPDDFGVCGVLRFPQGLPERLPGISRDLSEDRWYDIALTPDRSAELLRSRERAVLRPLFRCGGVTHRWVSALEASVELLTP
jgi:hypothetical protein